MKNSCHPNVVKCQTLFAVEYLLTHSLYIHITSLLGGEIGKPKTTFSSHIYFFMLFRATIEFLILSHHFDLLIEYS